MEEGRLEVAAVGLRRTVNCAMIGKIVVTERFETNVTTADAAAMCLKLCSSQLVSTTVAF